MAMVETGGNGHYGHRATDAGPGAEEHGISARRNGPDTGEALDALAATLEQIGHDQRALVERLHQLRRARASGRSWYDVLSEEEQPGSMQEVSMMLGNLSRASGRLRKELVEDLRAEGVSIPAIARMFGVTHQRVSNLLRRTG